MVRAVEQALGARVTGGLVNVKYGYTAPTERVALNEAGHPIPDASGIDGARRIAALLGETRPNDLVICLISGGGSALMTLPAEGITLADMQALTASLLRAGATINEINAIRKHLDVAQRRRAGPPGRAGAGAVADPVRRGGQSAGRDRLGPHRARHDHLRRCVALLQRYGLWEGAPGRFGRGWRRASAARSPTRPKRAIRSSSGCRMSSWPATTWPRGPRRRRRESWATTLLLSTYVEGEAREVARVLAALAKELLASGRPLPRPACLIAGGETTVTLRGQGKGGRNQEMALAAAIALDGWQDAAICLPGHRRHRWPDRRLWRLADGGTVARARRWAWMPGRIWTTTTPIPFSSTGRPAAHRPHQHQRQRSDPRLCLVT